MGTKTALAGPTPSATESGAGSASPLRSALAVRRPYALRAIVTDVRPGTPHRAIVAVYLIRGEPIWTVQRLFPSKARHFAWGPLHPRSIRVADRYRIASNGYIYPLSWTGSFSPISRVIACDLVISFSSGEPPRKSTPASSSSVLEVQTQQITWLKEISSFQLLLTHSLRAKIQVPQGQKSMCTSVSSKGMERKA
ncbi:hypothetical protein EUGRSUZ_F00759 [Eucalyptus grandis]|uniref:Uncharacterized protein n=2 Tax=Eucalyptus grandis TaxID=71139 RepID=A0ACC3KCL3_EUCGR|nr:hypothetical protein EUGRSUZ_F00759 [Eucalyptus grandis]